VEKTEVRLNSFTVRTMKYCQWNTRGWRGWGIKKHTESLDQLKYGEENEMG
jgi:hypothetical protein